MSVVLLMYTLVLSVTIVIAIILIGYAYQRRNMPGANNFILLLVASIGYNVTYIGELNATTFATAFLWFNLEHLFIPIQLYLWFVMCIEYVRVSNKLLKTLRYAMLYHPILSYLVFFTNEIHHRYIASYTFQSNGHFMVILTMKGYMYGVIVLSGTFLGVTSTIFYVYAYIKSSKYQRNGYLIMLFASVLPWVSVYLIALNKNYLGIDYFPVVTAISGVLCLFGIFQYRLFQTIPIATEMVFRQSREGILVIDISNRIIEINDEMLMLYPELNSSTKKSTFHDFVYDHPEYEELLLSKEKIEFQAVINNEVKYYTAVKHAIITEDELTIGSIITVTDITQFYQNQKALEHIASNAVEQAETNEISFLQAQISPHFVNNTLSVIGSMITRAPDEAKVLITNLGEYLANCYYFDTESAMVLLKKEIETVETYVNIEKARFRERLDFQIIGDEVPCIRIPRLILQPLVENAIRHGVLEKLEGGKVWLVIECKEDSIYFEVRDNGIGMTEETVGSLIDLDNKKKSIGITNIHKRLLKFYKTGLVINSQVGKGTTVSFAINVNSAYDVREEARNHD